ncbi:MAG: hypothetical protein HGB03_03960 [Candidatus Yonathbacteria bacterium]|nr:hypothetical protein [Candidatus Yonathbacteria bacterium]NTW47613.1 hypothetical protein [Candidatus Yonathbacteria bacterium]
MTPEHMPEEIIIEQVVRFTREDATHLSDAFDSIANIGGEEGTRMVDMVYDTARTFVACVEEATTLSFEETAPDSPWHKKETKAHDAFETSLHTLVEAGYTLPFDIATLNHKNSGTLAMLLLREHTSHKKEAA